MTQIKDPTAPATPAQINFLKDLVVKHDNPKVCQRAELTISLGTLNKGLAHTFISDLLASPKKAAKAGEPAGYKTPALTQTAKEMASLTEAPALPSIPAFGYYLIEGTVYYWDVTGKDYYPTFRKLTKITQYNGVVKGKWNKPYLPYGASVKAEGTYTPYGGKKIGFQPKTAPVWVPKMLLEAVAGGAQALSMTEAAQQGHVMGFCIRCGATLTDPVSVANGIGPVCAGYWA